MSDPRHRQPTSDQVRTQVVAMLHELERRWPGATDVLRVDSVSALAAWDEVTIRMVAESTADAGCSVAGAYLYNNGNPIIAVAESLSPGRRAFTADHELGHHLQQTTEPLVDALFHTDVDSRALEESSCDSFAAQLLIPDQVVTRHIGSAGPTADDIAALWRAGPASRQAVCARAGELLPAPGHVLLLDHAGRVTFSYSQGEFPLRRGLDQSQIPVVIDQLRDGGTRSGTTRIRYRDGIEGPELHAQATELGGFTVVVAVVDHAPWMRFSPPAQGTGPVARAWVCSNCGHEFESWDRACKRCGVPRCPDCRRCECETRERFCGRCFTFKHEDMFRPGQETCSDCD